MVWGMTLSTFTFVHVLLSLVGIGSGLVVLFGLLTAKRLDGWTALFLATTVATSVRQATGHRLPAVYEPRLFAEAGGLLSYGPLTHERFARVALYVDRILRGAQPGELPVEQPGT